MQIDWTPKRVSTLIALWNEGLSTAAIGRRLGVTKNAVVGKVHRLGLPKRQSPIRGDRTNSNRPGPKPRPRAEAQPRTPRPVVKKAERPMAPKRPPIVEVEEPKLVGDPISMDELKPSMCSWPIGEPGTEEFRFCGHDKIEGKPYCLYHCQKAYVKSSKKKDPKAA